MKSTNQSHVYKIVLVGDAAVGKTHILNRFVKDEAPQSTVPTIGVEFATKAVNLKDGGKIKAQIWDTAGQEKYRSITSAHYRKAVGALLVYDITQEKTFQNIENWFEEIKINAGEDIILMLVGNKLDLIEQNGQKRRVETSEAQKFAQDRNMIFEETSAFQTSRINNVFQKLIEEIYDYNNKMTVKQIQNIQDDEGSQEDFDDQDNDGKNQKDSNKQKKYNGLKILNQKPQNNLQEQQNCCSNN